MKLPIIFPLLFIGSKCNAFSMNHRRLNHGGPRSNGFTSRKPKSRFIMMGLEVKIRMEGRKNGGEKWLESAFTTYNNRLKSTNLSGVFVGVDLM